MTSPSFPGSLTRARRKNFASDPPSLSLLPGRQLVMEIGFVLAHGEGAGGIRATDIETFVGLNVHWLIAGDQTDYSIVTKANLADELEDARR